MCFQMRWIALFWICTPVFAAEECPPPLVRVSLSSTGEQPNHNSDTGHVSLWGLDVTFASVASNMFPPLVDENDEYDLFIRDSNTGELTLVSINLEGNFGNGRSGPDSWVNDDGSFVVFASRASDLVEGDTNGKNDVFVRDIELQVTERVSVSSNGEESNGGSYGTAISGDAGYVSFSSHATNLVPEDTNNNCDVFVHDRWTGETARVSLSGHGEQGNSCSAQSSISFDGHYVAFVSWASNLVPDDTNNTWDIFVRDRWNGETTRVNVNAEGEQANNESFLPSISADGLLVAFESRATNLVAGDSNATWDVFVVEWQADPPVIGRVSVSSTGEQGNGRSERPDISADGWVVAFRSHATDLVPGGASGEGDVYAHDRLTGITVMASTTIDGEWGNGWSITPSISPDGTYIVFNSSATNMVPGDTNGYDDVFLRALDVPPLTPGDVDCDGEVDAFDLALLLGNWGPCPEPCTPGDPPTCLADFDHDCTVGPFDLAFLLGNWGP